MIVREWRCDFTPPCTAERPHGLAANCYFDFLHYRCDGPGCDETTPDRLGALSGLWFFKRNGQCWCPAHIPVWVPDWRRRQREGEGEPEAGDDAVL